MSEQGDTGQEDSFRTERFSRIGGPVGQRAGHRPGGYSSFIRWMKIVLPLTALGIVAALFSWNSVRRDAIVPAQEKDRTARDVGRNELLAPRFESLDDKGQPYTVTAVRAVQDGGEEDMVLLEGPVADMFLNGGNWVAAEALRGAFAQKSQRLLLKGGVTLYHDRGYTMEMPELDVDLQASAAWTSTAVRGHGPAATLEAKGLRAEAETGRLVFNGPARLVLYETDSGKKFDLEGLKP